MHNILLPVIITRKLNLYSNKISQIVMLVIVTIHAQIILSADFYIDRPFNKISKINKISKLDHFHLFFSFFHDHPMSATGFRKVGQPSKLLQKLVDIN